MNDYSEFFKLIKTSVSRRAALVAILLFAITCSQSFFVFFLSIGPTSDPVEVYSRNYSSLACQILFAIFLFIYYKLHNADHRSSFMKSLKVSSFALILVCLLKIVISIIYFCKYFGNANIVCFYYFGETLAWLAIAFFAASYYKRVVGKSH